ncbi:MAG: outer membrane porin, OprD family [Campylobacterales bacterium]|nr:outer membrane porin, OprD family [Campylobacterales bacterium]
MNKKMFLRLLLMISTIDILYADSLIKEVNGYIRTGLQVTDIDQDDTYKDMALGGKLHIETNAYNGISAGVSFYTTNALGWHEGYGDAYGMPFFDGNNNSYTIVGEAYIQGEWKNTLLKIGRQAIDTPFADTDDIGMVPNSFEAALIVNKDITDTTITVAQLQKMAGVDAEEPSQFRSINGDDNAQTIGITYEGVKGLTLSGWYYYLQDFEIENIAYLEATYETNIKPFTLELGLQYASQNYTLPSLDDADIFGISAALGHENSGLSFSIAYNRNNGSAASNGFGGGPFFTSSEHLTLAEAGDKGKATFYTLEWDAESIGIDDLSLGIGKLYLESENDIKSNETDLTASYDFTDTLSVQAYYSDINDKINVINYQNLRVFVNYTF